MFQEIIVKRKNEWLHADANPIKDFIQYIKQKGYLREPQIEAIETYLFLKIAGQNKPLWQLIGEGFFSKNEDLSELMISEKLRNLLITNTTARALYEMRAEFPELEKLIIAHGEAIDFEALVKNFFYGAGYTDYLFSLPMGAGKTFLMAAFIYIDLYFAQNEPDNKAFAHNFIVLAPSGLKSSIVPSLKTIERFDPAWVIPEPSASQLKRLLKFELLDQPKSAAKSNRAKNPNAQKVANFQPFEDAMGVVLVVNAEKVILDKVESGKNPLLFEKTANEKEKYANELRHLIGKMPNMSILIDEVHHAATDDIKLRQVVNSWHAGGTVTTVLGFSGTPYLASAEKVMITEGVHLKLTQITNTVYYYPLLKAVQTFLKNPTVKVEKGANVLPLDIIKTGVTAFNESFGNTVYADGTTAKLAIYCSNIEKLEETIYPYLVSNLNINPLDILKYHQGNKTHKIGKENQTEFLNLDTVASKKKIILLVQIGKEGWDCRSLTGVILSQKGDCPTNMVLQTACRCLRQVHYTEGSVAPEKTALICLNEDNEKSLDKQLKDEQHISLADLSNAKAKTTDVPTRPRFDRRAHLNLPTIAFYQLKIHFDEHSLESSPHTVEKLTALHNIAYKAVQIEDRDLQNGSNKTRQFRNTEGSDGAHFDYWLLQIVKEGFGGVSMSDLRQHTDLLRIIFDKITFYDKNILYFNERFPLAAIHAGIRKAFRAKRDIRTREELIHREVELLLIQHLKPIPISDKLVPSIAETERILSADRQNQSVAAILATTNATLEATKKMLIEQGLGAMADNLPFVKPSLFEAQKDRTFHVIPYRFDSNLEKQFMENILQDADFQRLNLEIYFNGEDNLTAFSIDCYKKRADNRWSRIGQYYPDFLMIQRAARPNQENTEGSPIHRILVIETKGEGFARNFEEKKHFVETEFLTNNNTQFGYNRFDFLYIQDDDKNALQTLNNKIKSFFV